MTAGPNRDAGKRLVQIASWYSRCRDVAEVSAQNRARHNRRAVAGRCPHSILNMRYGSNSVTDGHRDIRPRSRRISSIATLQARNRIPYRQARRAAARDLDTRTRDIATGAAIRLSAKVHAIGPLMLRSGPTENSTTRPLRSELNPAPYFKNGFAHLVRRVVPRPCEREPEQEKNCEPPRHAARAKSPSCKAPSPQAAKNAKARSMTGTFKIAILVDNSPANHMNKT